MGNRVGERKAPTSAITALTAAAFLSVSPTALTSDILATFNRADWLESVADSRNPAKDTTFTWDAAGNLLRQTSTSRDRRFAWDVKQTLSRVEDNGVEVGRYDYGADGLRSKRLTALESVEYVLDGTLVLVEADGATTGHPATRRYHYARAPLAVAEVGSPSSALHLDALGSPTTVTTAGGAVEAMRQYDAFGQYRNATAPTASEAKLGFTGHQYDVESGLVYARARYYDAEWGRFLSRDSVEGSGNDAPSLHRYAYARVNPLRYVDPSGHAGLSCPGRDPASVIACSGEDAQVVQQRMAARKALRELQQRKMQQEAARRAEREAAEELAPRGPSGLKKFALALAGAFGVGPFALGPTPVPATPMQRRGDQLYEECVGGSASSCNTLESYKATNNWQGELPPEAKLPGQRKDEETVIEEPQAPNTSPKRAPAPDTGKGDLSEPSRSDGPSAELSKRDPSTGRYVPDPDNPPIDIPRVKIPEKVKEKIKQRAPKTPEGDYIDPNTLEIIPKEGPFDYGHVPGLEWWKTKQDIESGKIKPEDARKREKDPSTYQIEKPGANRSRKYEAP